MSIKGYPTQTKDERLTAQFATVEPVRELQNGLSVTAHQFVYEAGTDDVEAGSTATTINATAHVAAVGDVIRFVTGALSGKEAKVYSVSTNSIVLAENLSAVPGTGDGFQILRHKYPTVESDGRVKISGSFSTTEEAVAADGDPLPAKVKVAGGYDGSAVQVLKTDSDGELQIDVKSIEGVIDANNSTSTPLGAGATFTGAWTDLKDYNSINLGVYSNVPSATDGLKIQYSADGISVHHEHVWTYAGTAGIGYQLVAEFRYYRVQYVNDAVAQSSFQLVANPKPTALIPSLYRASTQFNDERQVLLTKGVITGKTTGGGGGYIDVKVNPSGALVAEVDVVSSALPTGAATSANQTSGAQTTQLVDTLGGSPANVLPILNSLTAGVHNALVTKSLIHGYPAAGGNPVVLRTTDTFGRLSVDINSMPAGSATEATLAAINGKITAADTGNVTVSSSVLPTGAATEATIASIDGKVVACDTGSVTVAASALPTGAATEATLATLATEATVATLATEATVATLATEATASAIDAKLPATLGQKTMANSLAVVLASDQSAIPVTGSFTAGALSVIDLIDGDLLDTSSVNIPGSGGSPVEVVASLAANVKMLQLLDTTGAFLGLYTGASGSEVLRLVIGPGSDQTIEHSITAGTRISLKRLDSASAVTSGIVAINFLG